MECSGHAGYAAKGRDIVCAAVSSILQTAALGVLRYAKVAATYRTDDKTGYLRLDLPQGLSEQQRSSANAILQTARLGIEDLCESYPEFVKMEVKEL